MYSPIITCICNKKESTNYDLLHLAFNQNEVKIVSSFSYDGYYKSTHLYIFWIDLLIEDGPSLSATIGSINFNDRPLHPFQSSGYDYRKAVILYIFDYLITHSEQTTTFQVDQGSVHLSIPKLLFSSSTLLHCLQVEQGYVLLSSSSSLLRCSLFVNGILSTLFQSTDSLQDIQRVDCLSYTYALQFEKECVIIQNNSILARRNHRRTW